jgi:hypothetical protein
MTLFRSFVVLACTLAACGGEIASSTSDAAAPAVDDAAIAADAGASAPDAAFEGIAICPWQNESAATSTTITYDKHCATSDECTVGFHLNNCCGQLIALGVNVDDVARFTRSGGICGDEFGGLCDCNIGGIVAEDGNVSRAPKGTDIYVTCVKGECRTYVAH